MYKVLKGAVVALGLVGATFAAAGTANAGNVGLSVNLGDVAFAYQDGYWDHGHHWHRWHNAREGRAYRAKMGHNYHNWNHNRDHDRGWHK